MASSLQQIWYDRSGITHLLRPLSWLFCCVVLLRRWCYLLHLLRSSRLPVPVIVVGNLTVGGTGKTPLTVSIINRLKQEGYRPGIVSRGYGGKARTWPQQVRPDSDPVMVGDEAVLMARRTRCPMAVGADRVAAANALLKYADVDIIVSDDGLQHYALQRDVEIVVVDGVRRFGNGYCLPAGPLREPVKRLARADFVISNGRASIDEFTMQYCGTRVVKLCDPQISRELAEFTGGSVHAIAGIGNPDAFFSGLKRMELEIEEHPFADHHHYSAADLTFDGEKTIFMTEKDAVKCQRFADERMWYLPIEAKLNDEFESQLLERIKTCYGQKST